MAVYASNTVCAARWTATHISRHSFIQAEKGLERVKASTRRMVERIIDGETNKVRLL